LKSIYLSTLETSPAFFISNKRIILFITNKSIAMGAKVTKIEGSYLPDTPTLNKLRIASAAGQNSEIEMSSTPCRDNNKELLDPRSPNGCRTPLNVSMQIIIVMHLSSEKWCCSSYSLNHKLSKQRLL